MHRYTEVLPNFVSCLVPLDIKKNTQTGKSAHWLTTPRRKHRVFRCNSVTLFLFVGCSIQKKAQKKICGFIVRKILHITNANKKNVIKKRRTKK